jgi:predicted naringenin-chalcone synthase
MSFITAIGTAVPQHKISQLKIADFMSKVMRLDYEAERKLKAVFRSSGILHRYSVIEDYGKTSDFTFYPNTDDGNPFPSTEKRNLAYRTRALPLSVNAIDNCLANRKDVDVSEITHLITVSCTGLYAPGLDVDLVKAYHLNPSVERLSINFMGCYAAFNAIKAAHAFCSLHPNNKVLIVSVELCSLHFQREPTEDNIMANALFADGAAALLMEAVPAQGISLEPAVFHNALSFSKDNHMAWNIGNFGFEMKLSAYVPDIIRDGIKTLVNQMLGKLQKKIEDINYFAIHPGGKRILEVIESELSITKQHNAAAYQVLRENGNMSSATIIFVIDQLLKGSLRDGETMLSFSFGPGLTLEGILFNIKQV